MRTLVLALTMLGAVQAQTTYYARLVAGLGSTGDGGAARAARVFAPNRITGDSAGNLYVGEAWGRIRKIAADGVISTYASRQDGSASGDNGPAADAGISSLWGLAVAGDYLYLAQRAPCNIRRIHLVTGTISNFAGNGSCSAGGDGPAVSTPLDSPGALAVDRQGRIYFTEPARIRRIDPQTGRVETFAGDGTVGFAGDGGPMVLARFNGPLGLAIDTNGNVFVSDTGNCRIRRLSGVLAIVTTVAGSINCGTAGNGGSAILAQLSGNADIALDATGSRLFIVSGSTTVRQLNLETGVIERFAGTGLAGPVRENISSLQADLRTLSGVWVDRDGSVLFSDSDANRVGRVATNDLLTTVAGGSMFGGDGSPAQIGLLSRPVDVVIDADGRLSITETLNRRVRRVTPPGILSTVAGSGAPGPVSANGGAALSATFVPEALARDESGNLYFTETLSRTVRVIGVNGSFTQVGPVFNSVPGGVAVDPLERYAYISLPEEHRIVKVTLSTREVAVVAGPGALGDAGTPGFSGDGGPPERALLNVPRRLFMDADGSLYIVDSGNHRIRRITPAGDRIETVAGNGSTNGAGEGNLATQASIPSPIGVTLDAAGNLYISNLGAIFRIDRGTNRLNRIAGTPQRGNSPLGIAALQASFHSIGNLTVDSRGVIYFADQGNLRVVALVPSTLPNPIISGIISPGAFGGGTTLSPGGWVEIYGDRLSPITRTWGNSDFNALVAPSVLSGVGVRIGGLPAFVQSISPTQINAVVPDGLIPGNVSVEVYNIRPSTLVVTSDAVAMRAADRAPYVLAPPAFARGGKQYAVAILPDGAFALPTGMLPGTNARRARSSDRLVLYGIGFGATNPVVPAGNIAFGLRPLPGFRIRVGGVEASVENAGLVPGYVGLYQFNFVVPTSSLGDVLLELLVDGEPIPQRLYLPLE